jgi:hypothetical protein
MAQNTTVSLAARAWTQLTNADVSAIRIQNASGYLLKVKATAGATPPTDDLGAIWIEPFRIIATDLTLAQLFPGVSGANRVYAYQDGPNAINVSFSHA